MDKKRLRKMESISMARFLENYCDVESSELIFKLSLLTHKQLKEIALGYNVKIKTISFDDVYEDDLNRGDVILVTDVFNHVAPYKNPKKLINRETMHRYTTQLFVNVTPRESLLDELEDNLTNPNYNVRKLGQIYFKGGRKW